MVSVTVVYYTSNREAPEFERVACRLLLDAIGDLPLVSVSQKPMENFGQNICVGDVGASYRNVYRQMLIGVEATETEWVALAESDALYPPDYFTFQPDGADAYVNDNLWILWAAQPDTFKYKGPSDGLLFARRDVLRERLEERLKDWPGFGPGKVRCPFRPEDVEHFTSLPVVSCKTGADLHAGTAARGERLAEIPYWGKASSLSSRLGFLPTTAATVSPGRKCDLSVLIPARNEEFLARTVADVLARSEADTEIVVVLDGAWADPPLPIDDRVSVVYNHEPVGQRAATNQACRIASGEWVMKLDAHCALDQGFDRKMLEAAAGHDDWTLVPTMFNLHAFDWLCGACGHRKYQGPTPDGCEKCGAPMERDLLWQPRRSTENTAFRFDKDLHFQYWGGYKARQVWENDCADTMSLLGACWMLTRERYFALDICDEQHGSWGQQGTEVACKTWLSGGRLVVNRRTWFAHLFRTRDGFGFPYPQSGVEGARAYSRRLWLEDGWPQAAHPLSWLLDRFAPVPGWHDEPTAVPNPMPTLGGKGIVYYTDNRLGVKFSHQVQKRLEQVGLPIVSVSLKPMGFGHNIRLRAEPGVLTMFRQILTGLEASTAETVFLCEHDVLYDPSHFDFTPPRDDVVYYNVNVVQLLLDEGRATYVDDRRQASGICANRLLLIDEYRSRVDRVQRGESGRRIGYEPGTRDGRSDVWRSALPNVDLRHGGNLTETKRSPSDFRNPRYATGWREMGVEEIPGAENLRELCEAVT